VLPDGDPSSGVVFVGEAPGETEDLTGRPFVGRSGKLMERMMSEEGVSRSDVLITNTVKCRPPGNRDPTPEEMVACRPFLDSEICGSRVVVGLGRSACRDLAGYEGRMKDIVNTRMTIKAGGRDIAFIPTFHPAACIYSRESREAFRMTIRMIKREFL
jgi:DNA polymerase